MKDSLRITEDSDIRSHIRLAIDPQFAALIAVALVLLAVPLALTPFTLGIAVQILLFALLAVGWNVMGGFGGLFSFGHASFFGIGAYTTAWLLITYKISPWLGMVAGAVLAAAFALLIGFVLFRYHLQGVYFALATFAFAGMLDLLATATPAVNAAVGLSIPFMQPSWLMLQFPENSPNYYYAVLGLLMLAVLAVILLMRSRAGRFILANREDELAAAALGVDTLRYKLVAVAASAAITAVGGSFYAMYYFFVNPDLAFGPSVSIEILLPAVIGGTGTIWGPVVGSIFVSLLSEYSKALVRTPPAYLGFLQGRSGVDIAIYGLMLVLVVMYLPHGLYGTLDRWIRSKQRPITLPTLATLLSRLKQTQTKTKRTRRSV